VGGLRNGCAVLPLHGGVEVKRVIALMVVAGTLLAGCGDRAPLEDEPGWNCATQGNKICGKVV